MATDVTALVVQIFSTHTKEPVASLVACRGQAHVLQLRAVVCFLGGGGRGFLSSTRVCSLFGTECQHLLWR
eukprot:1969237-Amphidinium_carterae.1